MKQLILCFLLMTGFTAQAQQLSPNFHKQFKDILTAKWEDLKGKKSDASENGVSYFEAKKPLEGFKTSTSERVDKNGIIRVYSARSNYNIDLNQLSVGAGLNTYEQLFNQVSAELNKLKNEGYKIEEKEDDNNSIMKSIAAYKNTGAIEAHAYLFEDYSIGIDFVFWDATPATTTPKNKTTTTSTTLSPNFYNQFKAILNTDWESLKGEGLDVDRDSLGFTEYYQSKKNLDGFTLTVEYEENKSRNTTSFDKHVYGENKPNPGNMQLFEKIKTELSKLKNDGFKLESDKNSLYILSGQQEEKVLSELLWDENRIFINFYKSYSVKTVYSNGDVYEGDYRGTTGKTVKGKYTWANGDVYEGDFVGNKRTGKGKMTWKSGSVYVGDFVDGKFNGKGKLTLKDGKVYDGEFKDGKFLGSANAAANSNTTSSTPQGLTATTSDPMETKFVTAFNAATDSEGRGKALGVLFGDVYKNASLSNEQKKSYMVRKVGEVYAIDKEAAFKGFMKAKCSTQEMMEVRNSLPADQKTFLTKRAQEFTSDFKVVNPTSITLSTKTNTQSSTSAIVTTPAGEAGLVWFKNSASSEKYGLMDSTTKTVLVKPQYEKVSNFSEGVAVVRFYEGAWSLIDKTGKGITPGYDNIGDFSEGLAPVFSVYQWGFIDKKGEEIIKPQYDKASRFSEGLAAVNQKGKWGYIDKTGKEIIKPRYDEAFDFKNNKARVKLNGRDFYIDKRGKEISDNAQSTTTSKATNTTTPAGEPGLLWLKSSASGGKYGLMDSATKAVLVKPIYDNVISFWEGLATVKQNGKWGFMDKTGKEIIKPKYDNARFFSEGVAAVELDKKWGFIDKTDKVVVEFEYDSAINYSEGLAAVKQNGKWGYIDKTGKEIIKLKYDDARSFSEGLAVVALDKKWGFIDKTDKVVVEFKYDYMGVFFDGIAIVNIGGTPAKWRVDGGKWGFIDKTGKEIVKLQYDEVGNFSEDMAYIRKGDKYGFIDKTGKVVVELSYDDAGSFSEGLARVVQNGKHGFIDKTGKEKIKPQFDYAYSFFENGKVKVMLNDREFYIDKTGKEIK